MEVFHAGDRAYRIDSPRSPYVFDFSASPLFAANPNLLEKMVGVDTVVHGNALVDGEMAVDQFDAAVGLLRDVRVVRNHQNRVAADMQLAKQSQDDLLVGFVKVAGGLVGKDQFRL